MRANAETLARISHKKAKAFLKELANFRDEHCAFRRLQLHFGRIFLPEVPLSLVREWAIRVEEEDVVELSQDEILRKYWLIPLRNAVRVLWTATDLRTKQWGIFRILEKFFAIGDRSLAVGPVRDDIEWVLGSTLGPVTDCERIFERLSGRTSVCHNSACPAPYFFAVRASQKYCSDACAAPAQREFKKKWWAKHGAHWRATRGTKRKQGKKKPRQSQQKSHLRGA